MSVIRLWNAYCNVLYIISCINELHRHLKTKLYGKINLYAGRNTNWTVHFSILPCAHFSVQLMQKNTPKPVLVCICIILSNRIESNRIGLNWMEWDTFALLYFISTAAAAPTATINQSLKSQFCVCTLSARRFICLQAYHGYIPVLSKAHTKAAKKKYSNQNEWSNVHR